MSLAEAAKKNENYMMHWRYRHVSLRVIATVRQLTFIVLIYSCSVNICSLVLYHFFSIKIYFKPFPKAGWRQSQVCSLRKVFYHKEWLIKLPKFYIFKGFFFGDDGGTGFLLISCVCSADITTGLFLHSI